MPYLARFTAASTISILGDRFGEIALPLLILTSTGDPIAAGIVAAVGQIAPLALGLLVGDLADRVEQRTLLIVADGLRALVLGVVTLWLFSGGRSVVVLAVAAFIIGVGDVLYTVTANSYLPRIVPAERLVRANSVLEAGDAGATLLGPAVAGLVIGAYGSVSGIGINAVSFAVSAALLAGLPTVLQRVHTADASAATDRRGRAAALGRRLFAGARLIITSPRQRRVQLAIVALNLEVGAIVLVIVTLAVRDLRIDPALTGLVLAGAGVGGLVASLLVTPRLTGARWGVAIGGTLAVAATGSAVLAVASSWPAALVGNLILDGGVAATFVLVASVRQAVTPADVLSRVTAASYLLSVGSRGLGGLAAGLLLSVVGTGITLTGITAIFLVTAAVLAFSRTTHTRLRELTPHDQPEAVVAEMKSEGHADNCVVRDAEADEPEGRQK